MDANPYESPAADPLGTNTAAVGGVSPRVISELSGTKPWVRFLAILGFLGAAFMLLFGVVYLGMGVLGIGAGENGPFGDMGSGGGVFLMVGGVFYLLLGLLYLFPSIKLWKFGSAILRLQVSNGTLELEEAMAQQRTFWKFTGIMAIAGFVMVILMVIGMVIFGFTTAASGGFDIPLEGESMEVPEFDLE